VRAALVVLINIVAGGRTGMRPALVQALAATLRRSANADGSRRHRVRDRRSHALSQLSIALLGMSLDERARGITDAIRFGSQRIGIAHRQQQLRLATALWSWRKPSACCRHSTWPAATALEGFRGGVRAQAEQARAAIAVTVKHASKKSIGIARGQPIASP